MVDYYINRLLATVDGKQLQMVSSGGDSPTRRNSVL